LRKKNASARNKNIFFTFQHSDTTRVTQPNLIANCGVFVWKCGYLQSESSQKYESNAWQADSSWVQQHNLEVFIFFKFLVKLQPQPHSASIRLYDPAQSLFTLNRNVTPGKQSVTNDHDQSPHKPPLSQVNHRKCIEDNEWKRAA